MRHVPLAVLGAILLVVPSLGAAIPVEGEVVGASRATISGSAVFLSDAEGTLDLAPRGRAPEDLRISFAVAEWAVVTERSPGI